MALSVSGNQHFHQLKMTLTVFVTSEVTVADLVRMACICLEVVKVISIPVKLKAYEMTLIA